VNFRVALGALLGGLLICCVPVLAQAPASAPKPAAKSAAPSPSKAVKAHSYPANLE
jgi:hypothetical protein